jgi:uncharacterized protein YdeI (YjbR/CyaY-like superfamily)
MKRIRTIDEYIESVDQWRDELKPLRKILQATDLTEEIKWGGPCYTYHGKNVVGMASFKSYFGLWFHQGALLKDNTGLLVNAQEGTTMALRQWRMTSAADIKPNTIKAYVREAIQLVKDGRSIGPRKDRPIDAPPDLLAALQKNAAAKRAFDVMQPGLKREYADYVAGAKKDTTRQRRIEKVLPLIAAGKGLNDKYR